MKKIVLILAMMLGLAACNEGPDKVVLDKFSGSTCLEQRAAALAMITGWLDMKIDDGKSTQQIIGYMMQQVEAAEKDSFAEVAARAQISGVLTVRLIEFAMEKYSVEVQGKTRSEIAQYAWNNLASAGFDTVLLRSKVQATACS